MGRVLVVGEMNPVMYIFVNKSLGMSIGKTAAQVGHAVCEAYKMSEEKIREHWDKHSYTKIILGVKDVVELSKIITVLNELEIEMFVVRDEGRTEIEAGSLTTMGVEILDKDIHGKLFKKFSLLR